MEKASRALLFTGSETKQLHPFDREMELEVFVMQAERLSDEVRSLLEAAQQQAVMNYNPELTTGSSSSY